MTSPRVRRLEEVLDIKPIDESDEEYTSPVQANIDSDLSEITAESLEGELALLYQLAQSGMEIRNAAMSEVDDCYEPADKSSLLSTATTALSTSVNAVDKAMRTKLAILKMQGVKKPEESAGQVYDRNQLLEMLKETNDAVDTEGDK